MKERLSYEEVIEALQRASEEYPASCFQWTEKKRGLQKLGDNGVIEWQIRFPWLFPAVREEQGVLSGGRGYSPLPQPELLESYVKRLEPTPPSFVLLLMEAGQAALGVVEEGELIRHKVIRKYMVRKKQGKAQLTHLKTQGKSRYGSRLRLANSIQFFEEINDYLQKWPEVEEASTTLYRCTPRLWAEVFRSKVPPPFTTEDERLFSIPEDLEACNFEQMQRLLKKAPTGEREIF